ncbi:MAG: DUF1800 domain-containing protein [Thermomicrobiales bacterium]
MSERERVQLLLWRTGFGATPAQVDAATAQGYTQAVEDVLGYPDQPATPPPLPPWPIALDVVTGADEKANYTKAVLATQRERNTARSTGNQMLLGWWADRLRTSATPLQENLTLFWHNHFATSADKVDRPAYMLQQNQLFRAIGTGKFVDLLIAVSKDPAMLIWLDGQSNVKGHPNENWSREVMELFTLGIGNYTEQDVREGARASTGWTLAADGTVAFNPQRFDNGSKTILGQTGAFNLDDFSRMLVNRPQTAKRIAQKLFIWFAGDDPGDGDLAPMLDAWNATGGEIRSVLRALFLSDAFTVERATAAHIKNPVSWTVGILRGLGVDITGQQLAGLMVSQEMTIFRPPNVGGWPNGTAWISPSNQVLRFNLAAGLVGKVGLLSGKADDAFLNEIADRLGGIPIADDLRGRLLALGSGPEGKRAVTQILLAGPGYQTR